MKRISVSLVILIFSISSSIAASSHRSSGCSVWSTCSATCGQSVRARICNGITHTQKCNVTAQCPKHSATTGGHVGRDSSWSSWSHWSSWSSCSVTCGRGWRERSRTCKHAPTARMYPVCNGPRSEKQRCADNPCIIALTTIRRLPRPTKMTTTTTTTTVRPTTTTVTTSTTPPTTTVTSTTLRPIVFSSRPPVTEPKPTSRSGFHVHFQINITESSGRVIKSTPRKEKGTNFAVKREPKASRDKGSKSMRGRGRKTKPIGNKRLRQNKSSRKGKNGVRQNKSFRKGKNGGNRRPSRVKSKTKSGFGRGRRPPGARRKKPRNRAKFSQKTPKPTKKKVQNRRPSKRKNWGRWNAYRARMAARRRQRYRQRYRQRNRHRSRYRHRRPLGKWSRHRSPVTTTPATTTVAPTTATTSQTTVTSTTVPTTSTSQTTVTSTTAPTLSTSQTTVTSTTVLTSSASHSASVGSTIPSVLFSSTQSIVKRPNGKNIYGGFPAKQKSGPAERKNNIEAKGPVQERPLQIIFHLHPNNHTKTNVTIEPGRSGKSSIGTNKQSEQFKAFQGSKTFKYAKVKPKDKITIVVGQALNEIARKSGSSKPTSGRGAWTTTTSATTSATTVKISSTTVGTPRKPMNQSTKHSPRGPQPSFNDTVITAPPCSLSNATTGHLKCRPNVNVTPVGDKKASFLKSKHVNGTKVSPTTKVASTELPLLKTKRPGQQGLKTLKTSALNGTMVSPKVSPTTKLASTELPLLKTKRPGQQGLKTLKTSALNGTVAKENETNIFEKLKGLIFGYTTATSATITATFPPSTRKPNSSFKQQIIELKSRPENVTSQTRSPGGLAKTQSQNVKNAMTAAVENPDTKTKTKPGMVSSSNNTLYSKQPSSIPLFSPNDPSYLQVKVETKKHGKTITISEKKNTKQHKSTKKNSGKPRRKQKRKHKLRPSQEREKKVKKTRTKKLHRQQLLEKKLKPKRKPGMKLNRNSLRGNKQKQKKWPNMKLNRQFSQKKKQKRKKGPGMGQNRRPSAYKREIVTKELKLSLGRGNEVTLQNEVNKKGNFTKDQKPATARGDIVKQNRKNKPVIINNGNMVMVADAGKLKSNMSAANKTRSNVATWSLWETWSKCSSNCGNGQQSRSRKCQYPNGTASTGCVGAYQALRTCVGEDKNCTSRIVKRAYESNKISKFLEERPKREQWEMTGVIASALVMCIVIGALVIYLALLYKENKSFRPTTDRGRQDAEAVGQ